MEILVFFELFFKIVDSLHFLDSAGHCLISGIVSGRVVLENLSFSISIHSDDSCFHSVRSHESFLGVNLADVSQSSWKHIHRNAVSILVFVVVGFLSIYLHTFISIHLFIIFINQSITKCLSHKSHKNTNHINHINKINKINR